MYNTNIGKMDRLVGFGLLLIVALLIFGILSPSSPSGNITEYQENEVLLKNQIKRQAQEIRVLKSQSSVIEIAYQKLQDSVKTIGKSEEVIKVVYREAVEATDLRPDSLNLLREVQVSRKLITAQEAHIKALLVLNIEADKLIASKVEIIEAQEDQITLLSERFDNMIAAKDAEIKAEVKKGNRKGVKGFCKGLGVGAAIVATLVVL